MRPRMIVCGPEKGETSFRVVLADGVYPGQVLAETQTPEEADAIALRLAFAYRVKTLLWKTA